MTSVLSVCLSILELSDAARIAVRAAATSTTPATELSTHEKRCLCTLVIRTLDSSDIITVRAERQTRLSFLNFPLPFLRVHAESSLMREPQIVFE